MVKQAKDHKTEETAMRDAYCQALIAAAEKDDRIVTVEADVMYSMGTVPFAKRFPERSINCGIQEANSVGVAAGLSVAGFIPFFQTFGVFASRRVFDQVFLSCAYAGLNVKIFGADSGVVATSNGGTHMPFEDMGIMRNIPKAVVIEPADSTAMKSLVEQIIAHYGVTYMRSIRKNAIKIYEEGTDFEIGKANRLKDGKDVAVIACGIMVGEALKAADMLEAEGISAGVCDMFTIKPIDIKCVVDCAKLSGALVTAENHSIYNGLGSAVAEALAVHYPAPLEMVAVQDEFGEVGDQAYLMKRFHITAEDIVEKAKKAIARKKY